jgi:hypothetical protein
VADEHQELNLDLSGTRIIRARRAFFDRDFTLEDAIGSYACSLEANKRVPKGIPLWSSLSYELAPSKHDRHGTVIQPLPSKAVVRTSLSK